MEKLRPTETNLRRRIFQSHLGMALLACLLCGGLMVSVARMALIERSSRQLESVRTLKKLKIESLLSNYEAYLQTLNPALLSSASRFDEFLALAPFHETIVAARVISDTKGVLATRPSREETADWPNLPDVSDARSVIFFDQECASGSSMAHCLTMRKPIPEGRLEIQISLSSFSGVVGNIAGLGSTGESYLISADGIFRSESRFWDKEKMASSKVKSEPYTRAIHGETGTAIARDYREIEVVSAFAPIDRPNLKWALISEIDLSEVLAPLSRMYQGLAAVVFLTVLFALGISVVWTQNIASPVVASLRNLNKNFIQQKLRRLGLYEGQELERQRVSQDLHDGVGQELTGLSLRIASTEMDRAAQAELLNLVRKITGEIRQISHGLMPAVLTNFRLRAAIENLCQASSTTSGIEIVCNLDNYSSPSKRITMIEQHIYRIIQEIIHNVIKHSHAQKVHIDLEREGGSVRLKVQDDGTGFDTNKASGKGLAGIRERVEALDGEIAIDSQPGKGTGFSISIPTDGVTE